MTDTDQGVGTVDTENTQGVDTAATDNGQGADHGNAENGHEEEQHEELLTKEEAMKMANGMLARKLKGMPTKEELAAFKEWKASQMTDAEKQAEKAQTDTAQQREYERLLAQVEEYQRKDQALSAGVLPKFAGYVAYEVGRMLTDELDYDAALSSFLKSHSEYKEPSKSTGMAHGRSRSGKYDGGSGSTVSIIKENQPKRN